MAKVNIGVDLAATAQGRNWSAVAVLDGRGRLRDEPTHFRRAEELVEVVRRLDPADVVLAVDAPRSVPDWGAENYAYRSCERAAKAIDRGAGSFSGVAALYLRWYDIETKQLQGYRVIETYPRVVWKRLDLPGKPKQYPQNRQAVQQRLGELVGFSCGGFSSHQVDATLCAYVAFRYANGLAEGLGTPGEGLIYVPAKEGVSPVPPGAEVIGDHFRRFLSMRP